jgi:TonB-dependent SusC/RagA subfamily outer membrane receptor
MRRAVYVGVTVCLVASVRVAAQAATDTADGHRGPRFFLATEKARLAPLDAAGLPVLRRRITLDLDGATVKAALAEVAARAALRFVYADADLPGDARVILRRESTVAAALTDILATTRLDVVFESSDLVTLVRRETLGIPDGAVLGRIMDERTQEPVTGVRVSIEGTPRTRLTGDSGRFAFSHVSAGERRVTARRLGYEASTEVVSVRDRGTVAVELQLTPIATPLTEVLTTATGDRRRIEIGNDIATLDADSISRVAPVADVSDLLAGRVPGLMVLPAGGAVGSPSRFRIRGLGSLTSTNDPIFIVDGIRVTGGRQQRALFSTAPYVPSPSRIDDLDPADIASIEVVKGPSAATLYGTDAANGVIAITTKRGRDGPPRWESRAEAGVTTIPTIGSYPENYYAWGRLTDGTNAPVQCPLLPFNGMPNQSAGTCGLDSLTHFQPLNHYKTAPWSTGYMQRIGVQVSGGAEQLSYFVSGTLLNDVGAAHLPAAEQARVMSILGVGSLPNDVLRPNANGQASGRAHFTVSLGPRAELSLSSGFTSSRLRAATQDAAVYGYNRGLGYEDSFNGYGRYPYGGSSGITGPGFDYVTRNSQAVDRMINSVAATGSPVDWLTLRGTVGLDAANETDEIVTPAYSRFPASDPNSASDIGQRAVNAFRTTLVTTDFGGSATGVLTPWLTSRTSMGVQYARSDQRGSLSDGEGLLPGNPTVNGAAGITATEQIVVSASLGAYVEQQLALDERFFIRGGLRDDRGSGFGANVGRTLYPKADVSWLVLPRSQALRLRAAYGQAGVQPIATTRAKLYAATRGNVDGVDVIGAVATSPGNPDVRPERTSELEGGADIQLWRGRLTSSATIYDKVSRDALVRLTLPASLGQGSYQANVGSVRNRGLEAQISAQLINTRALGWTAILVGSTNANELVSLGSSALATQSSLQSAGVLIRRGYPLFAGWQQPIAFADANGNGIIEPSEIVTGDSVVYRGPTTPTREVSFNNVLTFLGGRLRLGSLVDYQGGHVLPNLLLNNQLNTYLGARAANDPAAPLIEQARAAQLVGRRQASITYDEAGFVRWREVSVACTVPRTFANAIGAQSATVTLAARNLALWTRSPWPDPELNANANGSTPDTPSDVVSQPQGRLVMLRAAIRF